MKEKQTCTRKVNNCNTVYSGTKINNKLTVIQKGKLKTSRGKHIGNKQQFCFAKST